MAYDPGAVDATLAAAIGDEPGLIAELKHAFLEGAFAALRAMEEARDAASWRAAAFRLRGLAASFGAVRLMALARAAADGPACDAAALAKVKRGVRRL